MVLFACACITNERLTPELGYAVQPSSAVATRVSITVSAEETEQTQREKKTVVSLSSPKKLFSVSFSRSKLHPGPSDHLTPSSMNLKETNPPQRFIRLCSTPVKTRDTKSCGTALEGTSESFCHAVKRWALCYVLVAQTALSVFVSCARFCGSMQPFFEGWKKNLVLSLSVSTVRLWVFHKCNDGRFKAQLLQLVYSKQGRRCIKSSIAQVLNERRSDVLVFFLLSHTHKKHIPGNTEPYRVKTGRGKGRLGELLNLSVSSLSCIAQSVIWYTAAFFLSPILLIRRDTR